MKKYLRYIIGALIINALLLGGVNLAEYSFSGIQDFRKLERIPHTSVLGSVGGESQLRGVADKFEQTLSAPYTKTESLYYKYRIEKEERDSDGDTYWDTVSTEEKSLDFILRDDSGLAFIDVQQAQSVIDWSVKKKFQQVSGDYRYTEWRIDRGDELSIFGWLKGRSLSSDSDSASLLAHVSFRQKGDYLPIISSFSSASEREDMGIWVIMSLWLATTAFVLACFAIMYVMRWHKVIVFLSLMTVSTFSLLIYFGTFSVKLEVLQGQQRVLAQFENTQQAITRVFASRGFQAPRLNSSFNLDKPKYQFFSELQKEQINQWRSTSYQVKGRYLKQINAFPYKQYAALTGLDQLPGVGMPKELKARAQQALDDYKQTKVQQNPWALLFGLCCVLLFAWIGFLFIRVKRMQENIVASQTAAVVYGMSETNGKLLPQPGVKNLRAPLSKKDCCYYHYQVKESRKSGKETTWVTIVDDEQSVDFYCQDESGKIYIDSDKAEIISRHTKSKKSGNRHYSETILLPDDQLYIMGHAGIVPEYSDDQLAFTKDGKLPFIVANFNEEEVKFKKGSKGIFFLALGCCLLFLVALWIAGSAGGFSAIDFLLSAMIAPLMSSMIIILMMYNDLIFLKNRAQRNFANIQVALKKRFDLVPRLLTICQKYLSHEKELQTSLTRLRAEAAENKGKAEVLNSASAQQVNNNMQQAGPVLALLVSTLQLRAEAHPELKSDKLVADLHDKLVALDNEIAFIRQGFNDAVSQYNTRIALFPDNLLAKVFKFKRLHLLSFEAQAHNLDHWSVKPEEDNKQGGQNSEQGTDSESK